jgi:YD repeat-containing protein
MRHLQTLLLTTAILCLGRDAWAAEICGNGIDDDADGFADEGCWPAGMHAVCESPMSCKVTGDIAPKSGGIVYQLPADLDPKVAFGPSIPFIRRYVSLYEPGATSPQNRRSLGSRWQHNWQSWLDRSGSTVIVHLTTGQDVLFTYSTTSGGYDYYTPQAGYHFKHLRQATSSPNSWELRTLTGEVFVYDWTSPSGKLVELWDTVGNKVTIGYDGSGRVSTVTDASGAKRLTMSYTNGRITRVNLQTIALNPTTRTYITIAYTGTNPTAVYTTGSTPRENHVFDANGYLTLIEDGEGNDILDLSWVDGSPGKVARVMTGEGGLGFDYNSSHAQCTGGTIMFFNVADATSCNVDADCGGSRRCGGKTGTGSTGRCYRAARCINTISPSEDLVSTVTALTPCTGACAPVAEYAWNTSTLDLKGIKKNSSIAKWTSFERDANGMVITMAEGDTDSDATNAGGLKTFFFYDPTNPGKISEIRRRSSIQIDDAWPCNASPTGYAGCKRTLYAWNATTGLLDSKIDEGWTYNASSSMTYFSYTTGYSYDSVGRRTLIAGPLPGVDDNIEFTFHSSTDVLKNGYPHEIKRKKDTSSYLVTTLDIYDHFGNAKTQKDPDNTLTCRTFDANRNYVTQVREAMNGQTTCSTTHSSDLTTDFVRDSWLRLTRVTRPLGDCQHKEYDALGRLSKIKLRDDCTPANGGDTQEMTYDANGQIIKGEFKDTAGNVTFRTEATYHDGLQLNGRINPVSPSHSQSLSYATDGEFDELVFENGIGKTKWFFDAQNRETTRRRYVTATGTYNEWDFGYPTNSPTRKSKSTTDDLNKSVTTDHDDLDRRTRIVSPDSGTTLFVYDEASRLVMQVEAFGVAGAVTHSFSYDYLGRKLTENYGTETCDFTPTTEVQYTWDASPGSCPSGAVCTNQTGRLAYVKTVLLCDAAQPDKTLDQMTYYGFDAAGRLVGEYMVDDTGRIANQSYGWDKNGNMIQATAPSGVAMGFTFGGAGSSDTNLATALWRNNGSTTNLATNITWAPFGPVTQYDQANTVSGGTIRAMLSWNLAYRATQIKHHFTATGVDRTKIDYTEDAKGRYTAKVYSNVTSGMQSDYLQYDWFDRITCDAAVSGSCPTSGSNLKTSVTTYTASNDRTVFRHRSTLTGDYQYNVTLPSTNDKISSFNQTGVSGSTAFGWDARGNRIYEDESTSSNDRRDYTWEGRRRLRTVSGKNWIFGTFWRNYVVTNAYDHRDRRVSRVFHDTSAGGVKSQWLYYWDPEDRLIEVRYVPNMSSPTTYSIYQFYWLGNRLVSYFGTTYPDGNVARYFAHSDEHNRPLEVMDWPASGDATVVWAVNPDAFGWDTTLTGSLYQPFRLNGAYFEDWTHASKDSTAIHRPALLTAGGMFFDSLTASSLVPAGRWPNESYALASHNPASRLGTSLRDSQRLAESVSAAANCVNFSVPTSQLPPPSDVVAFMKPGGFSLGVGIWFGWEDKCGDCALRCDVVYQQYLTECQNRYLATSVFKWLICLTAAGNSLWSCLGACPC